MPGVAVGHAESHSRNKGLFGYEGAAGRSVLRIWLVWVFKQCYYNAVLFRTA